jgi:REP element-mobilizing transposase RayT
MPRQPRAEYVFAGGTYHVWSRGSNRGAIFLRPRDRVDFLSWLGKAAVQHEWRVLAYALLTNHYHLAVHIPEGGLSEGMKLLNGTFSRRQSLRHDRTAHLFENRFGCRRIVTDEDAIGAVRYVLQNPVKAGLCTRPGAWRWSSYRASVGDMSPPPWLDVQRLLGLFRPFEPSNPALALRRFVENGHGLVSDTKPWPRTAIREAPWPPPGAPEPP